MVGVMQCQTHQGLNGVYEHHRTSVLCYIHGDDVCGVNQQLHGGGDVLSAESVIVQTQTQETTQLFHAVSAAPRTVTSWVPTTSVVFPPSPMVSPGMGRSQSSQTTPFYCDHDEKVSEDLKLSYGHFVGIPYSVAVPDSESSWDVFGLLPLARAFFSL